MRYHALLLILALALCCASGCASIVSDNDSTTYIQTDPENARCELHGQDYTRVVNTPNSINLPSEAAPLTIACTAPGFRNTTQELDTSADGWIVGNLIFGGIIGAVVDAGRGAGQKYPTHITVMLEPEHFATQDNLDTWYDLRIEAVEKKWRRELSRLESACENSQSTTSTSAQCRKLERRSSERDAELTLWEERRANALAALPAPAPGLNAPEEETAQLAK